MNNNDTTIDKNRRSLPKRILSWLHQGYPDGVPRNDTFALLYVLERRLVEEDREQLVHLLTSEGAAEGLSPVPITRETIARLIEKVHKQPPAEADIHRIEEMLRAEGFSTT